MDHTPAYGGHVLRLRRIQTPSATRSARGNRGRESSSESLPRPTDLRRSTESASADPVRARFLKPALPAGVAAVHRGSRLVGPPGGPR